MRRKGKFGVLTIIAWRNLLGFLIIFILCTSCGNIYYFPNMVNSPLFVKKGEFKATVASGYKETSGYNAMLAYTPINHFGIIANVAMNNCPQPRYYSYNLGCGFYDKHPVGFNYEFYLGGGQGKTNYEGSNLNSTKGNYVQLFGQYGLGFENAAMGLGLALRLSYVNMYINKFYSLKTDQYQNIYIEPVLNLKVGINKVKIIVQVGSSVRSQRPGPSDYGFRYFFATCGLQLTLGNTFSDKYSPFNF